MNDHVLVIALGIMVPAVLTIIAVHERKQREDRYLAAARKHQPVPLRSCNCGECSVCDPEALALAIPGKDLPLPQTMGYGLSGLPVEEESPPKQQISVPFWAGPGPCAACNSVMVEDGFLCQRCTSLAGRRQVRDIYVQFDIGNHGTAWTLANALVGTVKGKLRAAGLI